MTTIDTMPVAVFHEIAATGNYSLMGAGCTESDWAALFNSFLVRFEYLEDYAKIPKLKLEAAKLYASAYRTGSRSKITMAEIKEREIEMLLASQPGTGTDIWAIAAQVSKAMGFRVNPLEVSVAEFYSYIRLK